MTPFQDPAVARIFDAYPPGIRRRLLALRELIFRTAASIDGVGPLQETLKWGEPAYVTAESGSGSTLRIDWKRKAAPSQYAMYFHCQTSLVESFRTMFPHDFVYEGNRAIVFEQSQVLKTDALRLCIGAALTYHSSRKSGRTASAR